MPFPGVSQRFEPAIKERRKRAHTPAERRTSLDALDVVACRARPVDAPTAWNRREAPFWSRMVTCTATLRDGLTTRMRSCIRQGHINICNSSAELIERVRTNWRMPWPHSRREHGRQPGKNCPQSLGPPDTSAATSSSSCWWSRGRGAGHINIYAKKGNKPQIRNAEVSDLS